MVGVSTATCLLACTAWKAARRATSVLPKPTSPQIRRSIARPRVEIAERLVDGARLILGLDVREARAEGVVKGAGRRELRGGPGRALGREPDELVRHVADALLELRLARLPCGPAQTIQRDRAVGRAIAREQVDVLHRQEEPVIALVEDAQAVVGRVIDLERDQAVVAADAVVDVHDQIAVGERRHIHQKLFGGLPSPTLRPARTDTQDVLLGDHGETRRDEPPLQRQHGRRRDARRQRAGPLPIRDRLDSVHAMLLQQADHAIPAAGAAARNQNPQTALQQTVDVVADRLEQRPVLLGALGNEIAPIAGAGVRPALRLDEGRALHDRALAKQALPFVAIEKERFRRDRVVGRVRNRGGRGVGTSAVEIGNGLEAVVAHFRRPMVEQNRTLRDVVEKRFQPFVEHRQPVLDPGVTPAGGDRFVERVIACYGAERATIGAAEAGDGLRRQQDLADRREVQRVGRLRAPLRHGIEPVHGLDDVAEEVEPNRALGVGGEDIDDTAAHGIVAGLHHSAGTHETVALQVAQQGFDIARRTGRER